MQVALRATERMDEGGEVSELWIIKQATEEDNAVTLVVGVAQVDAHTNEARLKLTEEKAKAVIQNGYPTRHIDRHLLWC